MQCQLISLYCCSAKEFLGSCESGRLSKKPRTLGNPYKGPYKVSVSPQECYSTCMFPAHGAWTNLANWKGGPSALSIQTSLCRFKCHETHVNKGPARMFCFFIQKMASGIGELSATGVILQLDATLTIIKKLKLVGTQCKIHRHTAFVIGTDRTFLPGHILPKHLWLDWHPTFQ